MAWGAKIWRSDGSTVVLDGKDRATRVVAEQLVNNPNTGLPNSTTGWIFQPYPGMVDDGHWAVYGDGLQTFAKLGINGYYVKFHLLGTTFGPPSAYFVIMNF
jgi:hypothetical protein